MAIVRSRRPRALGHGLLSTLLVVSGMTGLAFASVPQGSAVDTAGAVTVPGGVAPNPDAPRPYFPADVSLIPATGSLPDLFTFFSAIADPNRDGRVSNVSECRARSAELSDLMQYYLYGTNTRRPQRLLVAAGGRATNDDGQLLRRVRPAMAAAVTLRAREQWTIADRGGPVASACRCSLRPRFTVRPSTTLV